MHQKTGWIFRAHFVFLANVKKLGVAICFLFYFFVSAKDHFLLFNLGGILNWSGKMVDTTKRSWREAICFSLFCIVVLIKVDAKGLIKLVQQSVLQVLDMQEYN